MIRTKTEALSPSYIASCDDAIFEHVIKMHEYQEAAVIMMYAAMPRFREISTLRIFEDAVSGCKAVCFPETKPNGVLVARVVRSFDDLIVGNYGILSPHEDELELDPDLIDMILVPAMTYDREGYRIGRGGGYYDRYLRKTDAITVGLAREQLLVPKVPREAHDMPVKRLVTEKGIRFSV